MELSRPIKIAPVQTLPPKSSSIPQANVVAPSSPSKAAAQRHANSLARQTQLGVQELERKRQELIALAQSRARTQAASNENASSLPTSNVQTARSGFLSKAHEVQQTLLEKQRQEHEAEVRRKVAAQRDAARSTGFSQQAAPLNPTSVQGPFSRTVTAAPSDSESESDDPYSVEPDEFQQGQRDDDLALIEHLEPGPKRLPAPSPKDPKWERFEPYSGHNLRERTMPHDELTEYLRARFHIPPSLLYSVARPIDRTTTFNKPGRDGQYEIPVDGDWIIMATIVEKSDTLMTKGFNNDKDAQSKADSAARMGVDVDDPVVFKGATTNADGRLRLDLEPGSHDDSTSGDWRSSKNKAHDEELEWKKEQNRLAQRPRKFVILTLTDLGTNSVARVGEGSGAVGSNTLSLIVYEADQVDTSFISHKAKLRPELADVFSKTTGRKYINGSGGAFELLFKQPEGTLVAVMNPKVLKPYGKSNVLRLQPRSGEDCIIIGQASDYQRCSSIKANGERCKGFVDVKARKKTRANVCDFHLEKTMDGVGKSRPEFSVNATTKIGQGSGGSSSRFGGGGGWSGKKKSRGRLSRSEQFEVWLNKQRKEAVKNGTSHYYSKRATDIGPPTQGMENNVGKVYVSEGSAPLRDSDPASLKYDVTERYGRGASAKQARLRKQLEEEQLKSQIVERFGQPQPAMSPFEAAKQVQRTKTEETILPVLPNGSAEMINAAYTTLQERKRKASLQTASTLAKRKKYTGVIQPESCDSAQADETSKLKFMKHSSSSMSSALVNGLPIPGSQAKATSGRSVDRDARSNLVALAAAEKRTAQSAPNLKLKKSHRPKLRIPEQDLTTRFIGGERYHIDDFADDNWEADLAPLKVQPTSLLAQLAASRPATRNTDNDSDGLEII